MIPNLTLIVAVYVVIRLVTKALRQFPAVEAHPTTRAAVAACSIAAVLLVVLCTLDTLGTGLSVGSAIDARRGSFR
jgi:hypothetical protein